MQKALYKDFCGDNALGAAKTLYVSVLMFGSPLGRLMRKRGTSGVLPILKAALGQYKG